MRRGRLGAMLAIGLALAGCATPPTTPLPNLAQIAPHEWNHGPPWGPEEIPWVTPPEVLAYGYGPGYWGPRYWGPGYWGPSIGLGFGIGRGGWGRGYRGFHGGYHGGWRGGGHFRGGGRGRR